METIKRTSCMKLPAYVNKYFRAINENNDKPEVKNTKRDTFNLFVQFLKNVFGSGLLSLSLSEISDVINEEHETNIVNYEVKIFLAEYFQNEIPSCTSSD